MDIDSWLGDEPEAPPAGPACGSGAVHAGDCELLEMTPADRDPLANTMSEAKQMIVGSTTMVGCMSMAKDDDGNPTWRCVVIIDNKTNNPRVQCRFCDKVFLGGPSKISDKSLSAIRIRVASWSTRYAGRQMLRTRRSFLRIRRRSTDRKWRTTRIPRMLAT